MGNIRFPELDLFFIIMNNCYSEHAVLSTTKRFNHDFALMASGHIVYKGL